MCRAILPLLVSITFGTPCLPQDTVDVRLVEVPLRIEVDGSPIQGLGPDDLQLLVDGKPTEIRSLEEFDVNADGPAQTDSVSIPAAARRNFLLLFDRELTEVNLVDRSREAAVSFVLSDVGSTDLIGVATYTSTDGVRILVPFTTDRRQIIQALATLQSESPLRPVDPLGLVVAEPEVAEEAVQRAREPAPKAPRETFRRSFRPAEQSGQAQRFLEAMGDLGERLEPLPGHKHVVLFSRGFHGSLLFGSGRWSRRAFQRARDPSYDASELFGSQEIRSMTTRMVEALVGADCSLDTVDLGTVGSSSSAGTDTLRYLARETGGTFLTHRGLEDALGTLAKRTNHSYLLTFDPGYRRAKGDRVRSIEVSLANAPKRARITHRAKFVDRSSAPTDLLGLARRAIAGRAGGPLLLALRTLPPVKPPSGTIEQGTSEQGGKSWLMPIVMEIPGQALLSSSTKTSLTVEIFGYAADLEGTIQDHFAQRLDLDSRAVGDRLQRGGLLFLGTFSVPPGQYRARLLVRVNEQGESSLAIREFNVPEPIPGTSYENQVQAVILFPAASERWVVAPGRGARSVADSLLVHGTGRPTGSVLQVVAPGKLSFSVKGFAAGSEPWSAELLASDGKAHPLAVKSASPVDGGATVALETGVPALPAGKYTLVVRHSAKAGLRPTVATVNAEVKL